LVAGIESGPEVAVHNLARFGGACSRRNEQTHGASSAHRCEDARAGPGRLGIELHQHRLAVCLDHAVLKAGGNPDSAGLDVESGDGKFVVVDCIAGPADEHPERGNDDCTRTGQPHRYGNRGVCRESKRSELPAALGDLGNDAEQKAMWGGSCR